MKFTLRGVKGFVALGLVAVLFVPTPGLGQTGRFRGSGVPGASPGGGVPGGRAGRSGTAGDPNERWNQYTGGKGVWRRSEITDPSLQRRFDFVAQMVGATNGEITREQYLAVSQQRLGGLTRTAAAGAPGPGNSVEGLVEARFRSYDQNGDGLLNNDEMPESLKAERAKWDTNHDGFISLEEFKEFAKALMRQAQAERDASGRGGTWDSKDSPAAPPIPLEDDGDRRPTVYRAGNLPRDLPAWFARADTDGDGQVGLYEWRAQGWPLEQFRQLDRNDDGFVTIEEALRFARPPADQSGTAVAQASAGASRGPADVTPGNDRGGASRGGNGPRVGNWGGGGQPASPGGNRTNFTRGGPPGQPGG